MDQFEQIIEEAIQRANRVGCSIPEFIQGLDIMIEQLQIGKEAAQGDLKRNGEEG